jgi:GDP-mannose 6-dehydrogenase
MRLSIFGLGYVGAVSLACLARDGHRVVGVDVDAGKLDLIRRGNSPIVEPGIQELMSEVVATGRVTVTSDAEQAVRDSDLSFVCVGTPSARNGSQDLTAMQRCLEQIGAALKSKDTFHAIVVRSTVQPGTVDGLARDILERSSGRSRGATFDVGFQPEFLREGSSIKDYDNPPFTVVGTESAQVEAKLRELFAHLPGEFIRTTVRSAEMLKYACNAFHAAKVTFANEVGRISKGLGVDPHEVMELVCRDTRLNISKAYMKPGFAFGGSCLPKDLRALLHMAKQTDIDLPMLKNLLPSNRVHVDAAIERVLDTGARRVGQIGLSFEMQIYDPEVQLARLRGSNKAYIEKTVPHIAKLMTENLEELFATCQVVVVGLSDVKLIERVHALATDRHTLIDLVNIPDRGKLRARYEGVCW